MSFGILGSFVLLVLFMGLAKWSGNTCITGGQPPSECYSILKIRGLPFRRVRMIHWIFIIVD